MYLSNMIIRGLNPLSETKSTKHSSLTFLKLFVSIFVVTTTFRESAAVELTFELPDNAKECFYEVIEEGKTSTVEFQVCWMKFDILFRIKSTCKQFATIKYELLQQPLLKYFRL